MYATPQGKDPNGLPVYYQDIIGRQHEVEILAQIENSAGGTITWAFGVTGGDVTVDRGAAFRRSLRMNVVPYGAGGFVSASLSSDQIDAIRQSLLPTDPYSAMSPYGNSVRLWYGIHVPGFVNGYTGGDVWYFSLGLFRISDVQVSDDSVPTLSITGYDPSRTISRNKLTQPWLVASGTNWGDAIVGLALDRYPALKYRAHSVLETAPQVVVDPEQDPWQVITDWAAAFGNEVFFDADGYLTIQPEPDPSVTPIAWTYYDGGTLQNALLLGVGKTMSDDPGYNGVVLTAESSTIATPLRSEVWDDNPTSPTYALGPYGRVPKFVSNPYVANQAQADAAAAAELRRSMGGTEQVSLAAVPNAAHEAGDVIRVVRPLALVDHTAVVESFTIPLDPGSAMSINCRERRSIA